MNVKLVHNEHCIRLEQPMSSHEIKRKADLVRELFNVEPEIRLSGTWEIRNAPEAPLYHFHYPRTALRFWHDWIRIGRDSPGESGAEFVRPFWITNDSGEPTECRSVVEIKWR